MKNKCSNCEIETKYGGEIHCRKILIDEVKKLILHNDLEGARSLVKSSTLANEWRNDMFHEQAYILLAEENEALRHAEQVRVTKENEAINRAAEIRIAKENEVIRRAEEVRFAEEYARLKPIKDFIETCSLAESDPINDIVYIYPPPPTKQDWKLVRSWVGANPRESEDRRMLSARLAEKAIIKFYKEQGYDVSDISITQLDGSDYSEWEKYDVRADSIVIDVKNARRSERNPDRYVGHCVPRFKESRALGAINIAGVLSHWLTVEKMESQSYPVLFLGMTNQKAIIDLQATFSNATLEVNFKQGAVESSFFPPWIFNYPEYLYRNREKAINKLVTLNLPAYSICQEASLNPAAAFIAVGLDYFRDTGHLATDVQLSLIDTLLKVKNKQGHTTPVIFLSLLRHFLENSNSDWGGNYNLEDIREVIFPTSDTSRPLFLYDPLMVIDTLLKTLVRLHETHQINYKSFKIFRLQSLNILQGKKSESDLRWTTIIAYCGGQVENPSPRPCGVTPLVLGEHKSCKCGRLICSNCGFCSRKCPEADERKKQKITV